MVFACCFGGGGGGEEGVVVRGRSQPYGSTGDNVGKPGKTQEFSEVSGGGANKTPTTFQSGNTTSLSAVTTTDNTATYQVQVLNSALAGITGNWYERVSSAASRLISLSGAVLCSVSMLNTAHERFTVVFVSGKECDVPSIFPTGSQLPALQSVAPSAHLTVPNSGTGLRYNSTQVLQLLQSPLLYSFSDPLQGSRDTNQPPHDWQSIHDNHGLSEFCALPLTHEKSVVGAVTLAFRASRASPRQQALATATRPSGAPGALPSLMSCDESSMRTLGLLLSVVLVGQDLQLAQQVAEVLAGVYEARNLQEVVTVVTAGAEQMLQLTTRMLVTINLAMLTMPAAGTSPGALPGSGGSGIAAPGGSSVGGGGSIAAATAAVAANSGPVSQSALGGRAIFFEERTGGGVTTGSRVDGSTQGTNGSRSILSVGEAYGSGSGMAQSNSYMQRHRLQRSNTPMESQGATGASAGCVVSPRLRVCGSGASAPLAHPGLRVAGGGAACLSHEGTTAVNASQGGLFWQAGLVQARALGLRHTLLANMPSTGTIIHDCASYMQQVGCPKRDLYLLSTCQGASPFSLVLAPAPLKEGDSTQMVLYVAIPMRLPMELLSEILSQAQLLAVRVLAPMLEEKLFRGNLADEWALLLGCSIGKAAGATNVGAAAGAVPSGATSNPAPRVSSCALGNLANGATGGGQSGAAGGRDGRSDSIPSQPGVGTDGVTGNGPSSPGGSDSNSGNAPASNNPTANPTPAPQRGKHPTLPAGLTAPAGHMPSTTPYSEGPTRQATGTSSADPGAGSRVLAPTGPTSQASHATVLSTAVGGAFAGDTRTHMGMLVSSFKDTINSLQAFRSEEAEELSVLKLGKVLGRGGSGLVFQGYLHLGLEVAVKLFENPDDTDPEAVSADDGQATHLSNVDGSSAGGGTDAVLGGGGGGAAAGATAEGEASAQGQAGKDGSKEGGGGGTSQQPARRNSSKAAAQMTKRQRDLLRNALELGVTSSLSHPNIVQGYCHWVNVVLMQDASLNRCWLMGQAEYMALAPPGSPPPPLCSALVMEYCDMGSLIHALKRGTFTAVEAGKPNMEFIYMCLLEIALALRHLHTAKLAHCDLKPGNVLLRSSPRDPRGFVCKLGDFGYAAILKDGLLPGRPAVLPDEACGTLQYMAPELFVAGKAVDASIDIYAFGMLMWELITSKTPYSENEYGSRALMKAVYHGKRPTFPDSTLQAYKNLAMCCWSGDPNLRPSASVLVKLLRQQLESLKQQSSISTGSGSTTGPRV